MNNFCFSFKANNRNAFSGLTLAELLIATTLLLVILLTVGFLDVASRKFFSKAEKGSVGLNDISLAMEYIQKSAQRSIGDLSNPVLENNPSDDPKCAGAIPGFRIRIDTNANGIVDGTDGFHTFCFDDRINYNTVTFTNESSSQIISRKLTGYTPIWSGSTNGNLYIKLTAQDDPSKASSEDNPDVCLETSFYFPSALLQ